MTPPPEAARAGDMMWMRRKDCPTPSSCAAGGVCISSAYDVECAPPSARPDESLGVSQEVATAADFGWLRRTLERERYVGHAGEGTLERNERERQNERIDRLLSAIGASPTIASSHRLEEPDIQLASNPGALSPDMPLSVTSELVEALKVASRCMDLERRHIESNQVVDKDVHGALCRGRDAARSAITKAEAYLKGNTASVAEEEDAPWWLCPSCGGGSYTMKTREKMATCHKCDTTAAWPNQPPHITPTPPGTAQEPKADNGEGR